MEEERPDENGIVHGEEPSMEDSNLVSHARRELEAQDLFRGSWSISTEESDEVESEEGGDFYGGMTGNAVMELVKVFAAQGHSGMSAPLVASLFNRVVMFKPLSALTGLDFEWNEVSDWMLGIDDDREYRMFQNNRASHVFKHVYRDGSEWAYDSEAVVFRDSDDHCFTSKGSRVTIDFPYAIPDKRIIIDVDEDRNPLPGQEIPERLGGET